MSGSDWRRAVSFTTEGICNVSLSDGCALLDAETWRDETGEHVIISGTECERPTLTRKTAREFAAMLLNFAERGHFGGAS